MVIKLGTTFAEEVVTGLAYLQITSVDSVVYSGLMELVIMIAQGTCADIHVYIHHGQVT